MKALQETVSRSTSHLSQVAALSQNLTTPEAATFLGVKPSTLEQWRWSGRGPRFVKLGRACRYRLADLEEYMEARVFSSTTEAQAVEV